MDRGEGRRRPVSDCGGAPPGLPQPRREGPRDPRGGEGVYFGGPAWGGGLRAQIELAGGARDAMLLSPGVELWKEPPTKPGLFGHSNTLHETIFDADLSWLHLFASHVGWELGLRAGVITGNDTDGNRFVGPSFNLFTGMRF